MCVIIVKPAGKPLPSYKNLRAAFLRNPDGCGFVSETKRFKSLSFVAFYEKLKAVAINENCIIHFRLATHGSVKVRNCHPFYDKQSDTWFAHNGILRIQPRADMTDSETAFKDILAPTIAQYGLYSRELKEAVDAIIGTSKFAFMRKGEVQLFGHYIQYKECYYSNLHHLCYEKYVSLQRESIYQYSHYRA